MLLLAEFDELVGMLSALNHGVSECMVNSRFLSAVTSEYDTDVRATRSGETTTRAEIERAVREIYLALQNDRNNDCSSGHAFYIVNGENDKNAKRGGSSRGGNNGERATVVGKPAAKRTATTVVQSRIKKLYSTRI